jgi:hypothetical protein
MKLAIFFNAEKFSGRLTRIFTGIPAYHVGWYDEQTGLFYDMHAIRRRRYWAEYSHGKQYILVDFPEVTSSHLEHMLNVSDQLYGFTDYLLFGIRPLFHLFGQSTRNAGGIICSEMVAIDATACGVSHQWYGNAAPPSPADWYWWSVSTGRPMTFHDVRPRDLV